jgi:hypothetical protein
MRIRREAAGAGSGPLCRSDTLPFWIARADADKTTDTREKKDTKERMDAARMRESD